METAGKLIESEELREAIKDDGLGTPATALKLSEKLIKVEYMLRDKKKHSDTERHTACNSRCRRNYQP